MILFGKFNKSSSVEELIEKAAKRLNRKFSEAKCYLNKDKSSSWDVLKSIETFCLEMARNIPMPFTLAYSFSNAGEYLFLLMLIALLAATALFIYNIALFVATIALVFIIHKIDALLVNHNSWLMKFVYYAIALPFIVIQTTISEIIFFLRGLMFSKSKNNTKFYFYATLIAVAATMITILTITNILAMPNTALISIYCLVLATSLSLCGIAQQ